MRGACVASNEAIQKKFYRIASSQAPRNDVINKTLIRPMGTFSQREKELNLSTLQLKSHPSSTL
ncbi:MAG: hypothetical protein LBK53_06730 [Heliobacteriaceae bacterium]|nr:hypothetical protein [Heliobacteriaceae bacterium]